MAFHSLDPMLHQNDAIRSCTSQIEDKTATMNLLKNFIEPPRSKNIGFGQPAHS